MNQKQASRLLTLATFIREQVPRRKYIPRYFTYHTCPLTDAHDWLVACLSDDTHDCKGCALAWAVLVFPKHWQFFHAHPVLKEDHLTVPCDIYRQAAKFFGITSREAWTLFGTAGPATPRRMATAIEQLVDSYGYTYA